MFTVASGSSVLDNPPVLRQRVGQRIRAARERLSLSQEELGVRAGGLNKETINRIELGSNTTIETLQKVAEQIGMTIAERFSEDERDLARHTGPVSTIDAELDVADIRTGYEADAIPVIAEGEATPHGLIWTNTVVRHVVIEHIARPYDVDDKDAYGLLVIGDSMEPTFRKGHRLIVSPNSPIDDGDEVYAQLASGERLIKLAFRT